MYLDFTGINKLFHTDCFTFLLLSKLSVPEYPYINIKGQSSEQHLLIMTGINKIKGNLKGRLIK